MSTSLRSKTLFQQYFSLQSQYEQKYGENTVVLMQIGKFYEIFSYPHPNTSKILGKASELCTILNMQLARNKNAADLSFTNPNMIGFPYTDNEQIYQRHINVLINNNYTVVRVDQDPNNPKSRSVSSIHSPGRPLVNEKPNSNFIISIYLYFNNDVIHSIGLSAIDISIGNNFIYEISSDNLTIIEDCIQFIQCFNPTEIIINFESSSQSSSQSSITENSICQMLNITCNKVYFNTFTSLIPEFKNPGIQKTKLNNYFKLNNEYCALDILNLYKYYNATVSYLILLEFLNEDNSILLNNIDHPHYFNQTDYFILEHNCISQLNILSNNSVYHSKFSSVFDVLNKTSTAMGFRLLQYRICRPIIKPELLEHRYNIIKTLIGTSNPYSPHISNIIDLDRFHRQLFTNNISPKNISTLHSSYISIYKLICTIRNNNNDTIKSLLPNIDDINKFIEFGDDLDNCFDHDVCSSISSFNYFEKCIFKLNYNNNYLKENILPLIERIDKNYKTINNVVFLLNKIIVDNSNNSTNNSNRSFITLKQYNNDKEYYLECTNARTKIIKDNIVNIENYTFTKNSSNTKITTENIKRVSKKIYNDRLNLISHMQTLFSQKIEEYVNKYTDICKTISKFIAEIDYFISCANVSSLYNYSCPTIDYDDPDKSKFSATDLRHPLIERINENEVYIGNDISLGYEKNGILLYGTNACGKSSLSKAIGISIIMAQMGMFVPASSFKFTPYKNIYTRILGNDNIFRNESSFQVEMNELRPIIKYCNQNSMILGDEVCHGTEQHSAVALVSSALLRFIDRRSSFIFATHLHQLSKIDIITDIERLQFFHLSVSTINNNIVYDRKLTPGSGNDYYGINVANALINDSDFINIAEQIRKSQDKLFDIKQSNYNKEKIGSSCEICGKEYNHTHHIHEQHTADSNNYINGHHKNSKFNLVALCVSCHEKVHNGKIIISGYKKQLNGNYILDYEVL